LALRPRHEILPSELRLRSNSGYHATTSGPERYVPLASQCDQLPKGGRERHSRRRATQRFDLTMPSLRASRSGRRGRREPSLPRALRVRALKLPRLECGNPLTFAAQHQEQTSWCWSAVAVSVNLYYHSASGWTQCTLANAELGQSSCCTSGGSSACNRPWYLDRALRRVGNLKSANSGSATLAAVQREIDKCRPFCLRIAWNGTGAHFVSVFGYAGSNLTIGDPWYGLSVQAYAVFPGGYHGGGTWTHDYYTKP
jgi:hypothetical protein